MRVSSETRRNCSESKRVFLQQVCKHCHVLFYDHSMLPVCVPVPGSLEWIRFKLSIQYALYGGKALKRESILTGFEIHYVTHILLSTMENILLKYHSLDLTYLASHQINLISSFSVLSSVYQLSKNARTFCCRVQHTVVSYVHQQNVD